MMAHTVINDPLLALRLKNGDSVFVDIKSVDLKMLSAEEWPDDLEGTLLTRVTVSDGCAIINVLSQYSREELLGILDQLDS
jgi:hypothetical protein